MVSKVGRVTEILEKTYMLIMQYFQEARHIEDTMGVNEEDGEELVVWRRYSKENIRTMCVALVLCLDIGVDPPHFECNISPRARLEAWLDPHVCNRSRAAYNIGKALQKTYETLYPRARCHFVSDPTEEDVRRLCATMRRKAQDQRVLFHYNGHGVPRPTEDGDIWVFNRNLTQYIALSLYDLQMCMESPSVYVWDCSSAETIVNCFKRFAMVHENEWFRNLLGYQETVAPESMAGARISSCMSVDEQAELLKFRPRPFHECIHVAACREDERLPKNPDLPADLFTSCLTTPIHTSILWYLIKSGRKSQFSPKILEQIPGQLNDRRTILGELNWIFVTITDTIAWNVLPRNDFQRLFRQGLSLFSAAIVRAQYRAQLNWYYLKIGAETLLQDSLLSSLFRNFLLAQRVMGENDCNVVSLPALPCAVDHPLWDTWECVLERALDHIHNILTPKLHFQVIGSEVLSKSSISTLNPLLDFSNRTGEEEHFNYFFDEHLKSFELWIEYGVNKQSSSEQLPIVLQAILTAAYRQRAVELLARFMNLGQWAIDCSLSVGPVPYMAELLQSTSRKLRIWLAFIWAKILAVHPSVQVDLYENEIPNKPSTSHAMPIRPRFVYFN